MLKQSLIESLSREESDLNKYKFWKDRPDINMVIHTKDDTESPTIRLDAVVDYNARQIYDTLVATDLMQ